MSDENTRPAETSTKGLAPGNRIGPNGVILGPDGKPCKACNSLKAFGSAFGGGGAGKGKARSTAPIAGTSIAGAAGASAALASSHTTSTSDPYGDCPADVEQLGRHTWTFLHSTAAYYPVSPSSQHKKNALGLFGSLPSLYPCRHCASELEKEMEKIGPPDVSGRDGLSNWLCRIHNEVNERLGKREFDCRKVLERWKDGYSDGRCD